MRKSPEYDWGIQIETSFRIASDFFLRKYLFNIKTHNWGVKGSKFWRSIQITLLGFTLGIGLFIRYGTVPS